MLVTLSPTVGRAIVENGEALICVGERRLRKNSAPSSTTQP